MPLLEVVTNVSIEDAQAFAAQASKLTAELLSKPESYVMVRIKPEQTLIFAGSDGPTALVKLKSLGLPEDNTADLSSRLCDFIETELNIDSARIYIEFSNPERHMWGWDNRTF